MPSQKEWAAYPVYITPEEANSSKESFKIQAFLKKNPFKISQGAAARCEIPERQKGGVSVNSVIYAEKFFCAEGSGGTFVFCVPQTGLNGSIIRIN